MSDDREQMFFSFANEYETEDDALEALLNPGKDETPDLPLPHPLECDCCNAVNPAFSVSVEKTDDQIESAVDDAIDMAAMEQEIAQVIAETDAEIAAETAAVERELEEKVSVIEVTVKKGTPLPPMNQKFIRIAAAGFLAQLKPDGLGIDFRTGISRIKADAGAYFLSAGRKSMEVTRTILVITSLDRDDCWIEASRKADLLAALTEAKAEKAAIEEELKTKEPDLKDDSLFPESQIWDFSKAKSRKYHSCLRKIERLEHAIYHGSKFERLMYEKAADEFYLVVPAGLIAANELPEQWGLVYVNRDASLDVIREAEKCECSAETRSDFVLRAAANSADMFMLAHGISLKDGVVRFHPQPKRRKPYSVD